MANTDNPHGFQFEKTMDGNVIALKEGPTKCATDITAGDALQWDSGDLTVASVSCSGIVGVACEDVTGEATARGEVVYYPALPTAVFSGQSQGDIQRGDIGGTANVTNSTGNMELDTDSGSLGHARIVGLKDGEDYDSHANVLFVWSLSEFAG